MNVLLVGASGQLGSALQHGVPRGVRLTAKDMTGLDITDRQSVLDACRSHKPDVILNAAAYTAVDRAESEPELAGQINAEGVRYLAMAAAEIGARLIHVSTDFVFDGSASVPYTPDDKVAPVSVYGRTKRDGELAVTELLPKSGIIVRTAWLYSSIGNNFVKTMLRLLQERDEIGVVNDQIGTPTSANSLAEAIWRITDLSDFAGTLHWTDAGQATWQEFAVAIQEEARKLGLIERKIPIHAITTEDYPTPARRPRFSVLDCSRTHALLGYQPEDWHVNLHRVLKDMAN